MSEVLDISETYAGAEARLSQLAQQSLTTRQQLLSGYQDQTAKFATVQQAVAETQGQTTALEQTLQSLQARLQSLSPNLESPQTLQEETAQGAERLTTAQQSLGEAQSSVQTLLQTGQTQLDAAATDAQTSFQEIIANTAGVEQQLETARAQIEQAINAFEQSLAGMLQQLAQTHAQIDTQYSETREALTNLQSVEIIALFQSLRETLTVELTQALTNHFQDTETHLNQVYQYLMDEANQMGREFQEHITELLQELQNSTASGYGWIVSIY